MRMENPSPSWQWKIYPPRAMSSSVHLRSGLVWTRHLNTAPGDFTEVLYLESAFGAPTRTLRIKDKGHSVTTQYQASAANAEPSPSRECVVWMLSGRRSPALCGAEGGGRGGGAMGRGRRKGLLLWTHHDFNMPRENLSFLGNTYHQRVPIQNVKNSPKSITNNRPKT